MKTIILIIRYLWQTNLFLVISLLLNLQFANAQENKYSKGFLFRHSIESIIMFQADSTASQRLVGDDFAIDIINDKSVIAILIQDNSVNYLNAKDIGSSKEMHVWVAIQGPRDGEITPVIGAELTLETMSWFNVLGATNSNRIIEAFSNTGLSYHDMDSLDLNILDTGVNGIIVLNEMTTLTWQSGFKPWSVKLLGVNHDVYNKFPNGDIFCNQVQAVVGVKSWRAPGQLEITGDLGLGDVLQSGSSPVLVNAYDPIWIRVNLNVDYPAGIKKE